MKLKLNTQAAIHDNRSTTVVYAALFRKWRKLPTCRTGLGYSTQLYEVPAPCSTMGLFPLTWPGQVLVQQASLWPFSMGQAWPA